MLENVEIAFFIKEEAARGKQGKVVPPHQRRAAAVGGDKTKGVVKRQEVQTPSDKKEEPLPPRRTANTPTSHVSQTAKRPRTVASQRQQEKEQQEKETREQPRPTSTAAPRPLYRRPDAEQRPDAQQLRRPTGAYIVSSTAPSSKTASVAAKTASWINDTRVPDRDTLLIEKDLQIYLSKLARWQADSNLPPRPAASAAASHSRLKPTQDLNPTPGSPRCRSAFGTSGPTVRKKEEPRRELQSLWNVSAIPHYILEKEERALPSRKPDRSFVADTGERDRVTVERAVDV